MFKSYAIKIQKPVLKCTVLLRNMVKHAEDLIYDTTRYRSPQNVEASESSFAWWNLPDNFLWKWIVKIFVLFWLEYFFSASMFDTYCFCFCLECRFHSSTILSAILQWLLYFSKYQLASISLSLYQQLLEGGIVVF